MTTAAGWGYRCRRREAGAILPAGTGFPWGLEFACPGVGGSFLSYEVASGSGAGAPTGWVGSVHGRLRVRRGGSLPHSRLHSSGGTPIAAEPQIDTAPRP
ncbi:hypothetical protein GCM10023080_061620 [Streptomyces pseudoechinosporeus]